MMNHEIKRCQCIICHLTQWVRKMALDVDCIKNPKDGPVKPPELMRASLARQQDGGQQMDMCQPIKPVVQEIAEDAP